LGWYASSKQKSMPRKNLIRSNVYPYHVTARGNNKASFPCEPYQTWEIFNEKILEVQKKFGVKIHAFVMMSNHFHLLITTPHEDLGKVMETFMRSITRTMNAKSGRTGRVFGGPYHWSLINSNVYYDCALKYVYRNPVKAKLVH
jgi:putative transposase